jgi:hypothetical protein
VRPAAVLALQRAAGNRVARAAIARSPAATPSRGGGGVAGRRMLARVPTLDDQVWDLTQRIGQAKPVGDPLRKEALALAAKCWAARDPNAPDDAREQVRKIVGALVGAGAVDTAMDVAKLGDAETQKKALGTMSVSGIANEQSFLVAAGRLAGVTIAAPGANQGTNAWLDANTERIGQAIRALSDRGLTGQKTGTTFWEETVSQVLSTFFRAATDAEGDIRPDPLGRLAGRTVDPQTKEIVADCDVWATYGARLFRAMGWTTVAYLSIIPDEKNAAGDDRAGHAVVLVRLDSGGTTTFAGVSDFYVRKFAATTETAAQQELLDLGLEIYSPRLQKYKSYYLAAGQGGAYDVRILDPVKNKLTPWKTVP